MPFWTFKNLSDEETELRIDGEIVSDDYAWIYEWFDEPHTAPNKFRQALNDHKGKNITVWIDSWGGDVFAGAGIYNALKNHKGRVTAKIDGKAVSAASVIAMAADSIQMSPVSIMMIHNPWTWTAGEAKDMRHAADVLDEVKKTILNAYQAKTGKDRTVISDLMDKESWMSSKTAIAEGFADGELFVEPEAVQNSFMVSRLAIQNSADSAIQKFFEQFKKIGAGHKPDPQVPEDTPANNRIVDIQRRVSVREKSYRRLS